MLNHIIQEDCKSVAGELGKDIYKLEGANILITGAFGMLASYLVYLLMYANENIFKKPAQLYLVTRSKKKKFGSNKNLHYLSLDITKEKPSVTNMHYIIHAASKAAPKLYEENMIDTLNSNILGLYNLLAICNKNTRSFLFFSSAEIYGSVGKAVDEGYIGTVDHLSPRSCYVEAKKVCETICMNYFREKNIPVKIVRIFHTFGPGVNLSDGRIFNDFIKYGLEKKDIKISGNPKLERSFLYIKDATTMFLKILVSEKNGEIYNVGGDNNITTVEGFANIVCSTFNILNKQKNYVLLKQNKDKEYYENAVKCIKPSLKKFKRDFNYQPTTTIEKAVQRTVRYLIEEIE